LGSKRVNRKASTNSSRRHAVLEAEADGDGEAVGHAAEGGLSLCMSMKISPRVPSSYYAGADVHLCVPMRAFCV